MGLAKVFAVLGSTVAPFCAAGYAYYEATLNDAYGAGASGHVTVLAIGDKLGAIGTGVGLEPGLSTTETGGTDCAATNQCGTHIHSGTSCDPSSRGGHLSDGNGDDHWGAVRYPSTNGSGYTTFANIVTMPGTDMSSLAGKPFVLHNSQGGTVACGLLTAAAGPMFAASTAELSSSGATGDVRVLLSGDYTRGMVVASGLQTSLTTGNCTARNGCGTHIHSGTACDSANRGGHYYSVAIDPWLPVKYPGTTGGNTASLFEVQTGVTDLEGKPFLLHDSSGDTVSCGLLATDTTPAPTPLTSGQPAKSLTITSVSLLSGLAATQW